MFYSLYCTPPKRKLHSAHLALKDHATAEKITVSRYAFDNRPMTLSSYRWGQSNKKILLLHGWGGSPFDFKYMIQALVAGGYEVISYDAPAHGASDGKKTNLVQWMHVLEQLLRRTGPVHAVIGHSLGGLSAALTLVHKEITVPRLILASSAVSAPAVFQDSLRDFHIPGEVMPILEELVRKRLHQNLHEMDLFLHINQIKASQILVVYDENDPIAKADQISEFVEKYPAIQSLKINGEGHFRIMKNEKVIHKVLEFLGTDV